MGKVLLGVLLCLPFAFWGGSRVYRDVIFERQVTGRIKRAADANSVKLAKQELEAVLKFLDLGNVKEGYTSILYTTPDEDVTFWYNNLLTCYQQLKDLSVDTKQSEQDMVLMKLRQTLLDHDGGKEVVTQPKGISIFPNNTVWAFWGIFGSLLGIVGAILFMLGCTDVK